MLPKRTTRIALLFFGLLLVALLPVSHENTESGVAQAAPLSQEDIPICRNYADGDAASTGCNDLQIVLLIDDSASMLTNDPKNVRFDGVAELLDILAEKYLLSRADNLLNPSDIRIAAVHFGSTVGFNSGWQTINPESAKDWENEKSRLVQALDISKGPRNLVETNFVHPFTAARNLFESATGAVADGCRNRLVLVLTDGMPSGDRIKTLADVHSHMEQVEIIADQIFTGQDRKIYLTVQSAEGSKEWESTRADWDRITRNDSSYRPSRVKRADNAQILAAHISNVIAENTGLQNLFLEKPSTEEVPPNVEVLRVTHFTPDESVRLEVTAPDGQLLRTKAGTNRQVLEIRKPVPGIYTFNSANAGSSVNLVFRFSSQVDKFVPPNLSLVKFTYTIGAENPPQLRPGEVIFTVNEPNTGRVYTATATATGYEVAIPDPVTGVYVLTGALSNGELRREFEYPQRAIRFSPANGLPQPDNLQRFTKSTVRFELQNPDGTPLTLTPGRRFLALYTYPGPDMAQESGWLTPVDGEFSLDLLPPTAGAGSLQVSVITTDISGNDCILYETGPQPLAVDPVIVDSAAADVKDVCVPIGQAVENALTFRLLNGRTQEPALVSLPVAWQAQAVNPDGQAVGIKTDVSGGEYRVSLLPVNVREIRTTVSLDVLTDDGAVSLFDETHVTRGFFQRREVDFRIRSLDWRADNLTNPLFRFLYDINGPPGEERVVRYRFFNWTFPTKMQDAGGSPAEVLFGYRILGWFGPKEIEVRADFDPESSPAGLPAVERYQVQMTELGLPGKDGYASEWLNDWEATSEGAYRLVFPSPPFTMAQTTAYMFRIKDIGEPAPCEVILPSPPMNFLIVVPYWGTLAALALGALHIPNLRRRYRLPDDFPTADYTIEFALADDLTLIEGIGPKVQALLNAHDIYTYEQLAVTSPEDLQQWVDEADWPYMSPQTWPLQAFLAADRADDFEKLNALKDILKGGRFENTEDMAAFAGLLVG